MAAGSCGQENGPNGRPRVRRLTVARRGPAADQESSATQWRSTVGGLRGGVHCHRAVGNEFPPLDQRRCASLPTANGQRQTANNPAYPFGLGAGLGAAGTGPAGFAAGVAGAAAAADFAASSALAMISFEMS